MGANHLDNISIIITLSSAPVPQAGFGTVMLLVPLATNSLDGNRFVIYESVSGAQADETAGFISAATLAAITVAFSQRPQPTAFQVGYVDLVGAETYAQGLAACILAGAEVYAICMDSRVAATQVSLSTAVEAAEAQFLVLQSADADWITTGLPAAFTTLAGNEKTALSYHDDDTEWSDVAWAVNRLAYNPDSQAVPWDTQVQAVAALTTTPTDTQKGFAKANCNIGLPYGGEVFFIDPGQNFNSRPIYEVVTADWFDIRLREAVTSLKTTLSGRGQKLPVTFDGQARVLADINALYEQGVNAGHFVAGQTIARGLPITTADTAAQRLRFSGEAQLVTSARIFSFTFNFGLDPLASA